MTNPRNRLPDAKELAVVAMYDDGYSSLVVAKHFGIAQSTVTAACRRQGIPVRARATTPGPGGPSWRGGKVVNKQGYVKVWVSQDSPFIGMAHHTKWGTSYILEHRFVMAVHLDRPLTRNETVHHKNGDKMDNRIENLQLRQGKHGKGVNMICAECGSHNIVAAEL